MATAFKTPPISTSDRYRALAPMIISAYKNGDTLTTIKARYGVNDPGIYKVLHDNGVPLRTATLSSITPADTRPAFVVEKGVPIPSRRNIGRPSIYPWASMQVGDSFFAPIGKGKAGVAKGSYNAQKLHGIKLTTRSVTENGRAGVRIWRTA